MCKISACIITKNEEKYIGRCLDSIKDVVDEIIILDGCSIDKTVDICKKYTERIYVQKFSGSFAKERTTILSKARYDWILQIDADETLSEDLQKFIKEFNSDKYVAYSFVRRNYYDFEEKRWTKYVYYPDYQPRLILREKLRYNLGRTIMEEAIIDGKISYLSYDKYMNHYVPNKYALSNFKNQHLRSIKLQSKWYKKDKSDFYYILIMFPTLIHHFIYMFIKNKWYKDGFVGFKASFIMALYMMMVNYYIVFDRDLILIPLKLFEINNRRQKQIDNIYKEKIWKDL